MFSIICILLEVVFIITIVTRLNEYAEIINLFTRILSGILVLRLYASDKTSSMKMPWVILILIFPIMGVGLYLLIGLNGGTHKMRERYAEIASYIQRNSQYPIYQNTDVMYFDEAVKGLETQLEDLAKAQKFIFMEYHAIEDAEAWHKIQKILEERVKVGEEVYISMINKAEKYCWFMTPYLIITDEMTHALCLAAKRGVDIRIITPGIPDKKFIYNITRSFYHGLVKHGVRVYEWTPGFCHAKMSVVDDCMAICGTINLDYRSLYHHFENGCFMIDCQSVLDIKSDLIKTMGECRDVTEQYCTGRSAYLRLGQLFAGLL